MTVRILVTFLFGRPAATLRKVLTPHDLGVAVLLPADSAFSSPLLTAAEPVITLKCINCTPT